MEQGGINSITLYEDKGINVVYDGSNEIENIYTAGDTIEITNDARINFSFETKKYNNKLKFVYTFDFIYWDLTLANFEEIQTLKKSIYGWKPLITFFNGNKKFIDTVFMFIDSKTENKKANYKISMSNQIPTLKGFETWVGIPAALEGVGYWFVEIDNIVQ